MHPHEAPKRRLERIGNPISRSLAPYIETGFRPDIEGMRALAVGVVVLYHAHFFGLTGGFIGVDVFFVLSGFLITRLILGEMAATGRLSLRSFWARRARRLLPASALVVAVTAIASHRILPPLTQGSVATDVVAAGTFTSNFVFAGRLGGYFGAQLGASTPSPLLHFWSLAVEEQFYLVWPPLLVLLTSRPRQYRRLLFGVIGVLGLASVLFAIWLTPRSPSWAFYLLPTRMGELLAGALLAVLGIQVLRVAASVRAGMAWAGLAVIAIAVFSFDETMPWPGSAVLVPVLATMAVIVGGSVTSLPWAPSRLLRATPLQWLGRHSYALYLWHWPVLVLAEAAAGRSLSWPTRVVAIGLAVALSSLSLSSSRILSATPERSPRCRNAASPWAPGCLLVVVGSGAWLRSAIPSLDGGEVAAAPQLSTLEAAPVPEIADHGDRTGRFGPRDDVGPDDDRRSHDLDRRSRPRAPRSAQWGAAVVGGLDAATAGHRISARSRAVQPSSLARRRSRTSAAVHARVASTSASTPACSRASSGSRAALAPSCCTATPMPCSGSNRCSRSRWPVATAWCCSPRVDAR